MTKKKEVAEVKPFDGFSLLKGEFRPPVDTNEDDVKTGLEGDISDDEPELSDEEAARMAAADKKLEEVARKTAEARKKKDATPELEETDDTDKNKSDNQEELTGIKGFVKALSEKGVIDFDDSDEEFVESEDGIEKLIDKTVSKRTNDNISKWVSGLPDDLQKLMNFVENGGDPKTFLDVYYGNSSWEEFKLDSEEAQKAALRESLRLAGETPEDIEDIVTEYSDNGTLEKRSKSALVKLQKHEAASKAEIVEEQKKLAVKRQADEKAYWEGFKKDIFDREDVKGFKLTPKVKENIWDFMTKVDKSGKTEYQKAVEADKDASLLFAYLAMNKFDTSKLEKQVESKVANRYAGLLKNYQKDSRSKMSGGGTPNFDNGNPFSAFGSK